MDYDVVIRCKNEIEWLPRVLKSLQLQSIKPSNILLVDDNSTDGSSEYARANGCKIIDYDKNDFNYSYALNLGLKQTKSKYILILSAMVYAWDKTEDLGARWIIFLGGIIAIAFFLAK